MKLKREQKTTTKKKNPTTKQLKKPVPLLEKCNPNYLFIYLFILNLFVEYPKNNSIGTADRTRIRTWNQIGSGLLPELKWTPWSTAATTKTQRGGEALITAREHSPTCAHFNTTCSSHYCFPSRLSASALPSPMQASSSSSSSSWSGIHLPLQSRDKQQGPLLPVHR